MKVTEREITKAAMEVVNYCCGDMKYHINTKSITFSVTGFFIFGTYGLSYCPFCGKKIDYE